MPMSIEELESKAQPLLEKLPDLHGSVEETVVLTESTITKFYEKTYEAECAKKYIESEDRIEDKSLIQKKKSKLRSLETSLIKLEKTYAKNKKIYDQEVYELKECLGKIRLISEEVLKIAKQECINRGAVIDNDKMREFSEDLYVDTVVSFEIATEETRLFAQDFLLKLRETCDRYLHVTTFPEFDPKSSTPKFWGKKKRDYTKDALSKFLERERSQMIEDYDDVSPARKAQMMAALAEMQQDATTPSFTPPIGVNPESFSQDKLQASMDHVEEITIKETTITTRETKIRHTRRPLN